MAKLTGRQIQELARQIVAQSSGGIRYGALVERIAQLHPETPRNTIHGSVWDLAARFPSEITKPSRGLYLRSGAATAAGSGQSEPPPNSGGRLREEQFYDTFADWLKNDLDEATVARGMGGAGMQRKWGTPDVVGVYKPLASDRIRFPVEIISAEVKIDPQAPVVAFGQAAAYRLFSSKSYVVMPTSISEEDYSRLEALCMLYGIGLVLFELDLESPKFQIRVRAQRFSPDMFYVNEFAERLHQLDPGVFNQLFG